MPFQTDAELGTEFGRMFGDYLETFVSEHGQVRADIFRRGDRLEAHVSFSTGIDARTVTDRYVSELAKYASEHGYGDRLRMILS